MTVGFKYCALYYLNQWISKDRGFCGALASQNELEQLTGLASAAAFYRVARNLPEHHDVGKKFRRYEPVLRIICAQQGTLSAETVLPRVKAVRDRISKEYGGRGVLSLTTKFLWLRFRSPVIIYDSQVRTALGTRPGNIDDYYTRWRETFEKHAGDISAACGSLSKVREYCIEPEAITVGDVATAASQRWFQERVLDVYLWHRGLDA